MAKHFGVFLLFLVGISISIFLAFTQTLNPSKKPQQPVTQNKPTPKPATQSIQSILQSGKDETCSVSYLNDLIKGTIYISNKRVRGDFAENHIIYDGQYTYFWSQNKGTKIKNDQSKNMSASESAQQIANLETVSDINCSPWTLDKSKFSLPEEVTFTEATQIQKTATSSSNLLGK